MELSPVGREVVDILLALAFLLAVGFVVLIDLHFYWAKGVEERQDALDARLKALEERGP